MPSVVHHRIKHLLKVKCHLLDAEFAGLNFGNIENVIENMQQVLEELFFSLSR